MIAAIAVAGPLPAILDAIRIRERRREELVARLSAAKRTSSKDTSSRDLRGRIMKRLDDWRSMLERPPVQARQTVIRPLLGGRIVLTPDDRSYRFEAPVSWGGLVAGPVDGFGVRPHTPGGHLDPPDTHVLLLGPRAYRTALF